MRETSCVYVRSVVMMSCANIAAANTIAVAIVLTTRLITALPRGDLGDLNIILVLKSPSGIAYFRTFPPHPIQNSHYQSLNEVQTGSPTPSIRLYSVESTTVLRVNYKEIS